MAKNKDVKQPREYTKRQLSHAKKQALRQKIFMFTGIGVIVAVVLLILAGWLFGEFLPDNKAIASVYDENITQKQLVDTLVVYGGMYGIDITQNIDYIMSSMVQSVLVKQAAAKLGITVSDEEVKTALNDADVSDAYKENLRASLLTEKLKKEHFNNQVPDSGNQVLMNAMLVESAEIVPEVRERLMGSDNFSMLAEEYAVNVVSKNNKGSFDWHPQEILVRDISTAVPVDWAFSETVTKGQISEALTDNASSKQLGYWLLRLNEKPITADEESTANVSALLLSSEAEALRIKAQLEAGADLAELADKLSQYSPSQMGHGNIKVDQSENISIEVNDYVFNPDTPLGEWSAPIKDNRYYTKGGAWIVQIVDKSNDHPYSEADKNSLVDTAFSEWVNSLWLASTTEIKYTFDEADRARALDEANRQIAKLQDTGV